MKTLMASGPVRSVMLLAAPLFLAACASSGGGTGSADGDRCSSDLARSNAPLTEALDSAVAYAALEPLLSRHEGLVLASISAPGNDGPRAGQVFAEGLDTQATERMRDVLRGASRLKAGSDERIRLVLRDESGMQLRRVDRFAQCAPTIRNRSVLERQILSEAEGLNITQRMVVQIFAFVQADGLVSEVRVDESSGNVAVDLAAARVFDGVRFTPAVIEGLLAPVWVQFPVTFTPRG